MKLSDLAPSPGSRRKRKRVGRGPGSGHGKTSCRGHKGQNSRSGGGTKAGFEGGQMPLQRRLPKRGFTNIFQKNRVIVNVGVLEKLEETTITPELLVSEGIIKDIGDGVKILGNGDITRSITVKAHAFSVSAREKIEKAKGSIELL
ncbi:MAG: 50S ribosomal protein L15 [Nitrospira bacterium SG8_35_4]|nr:MAG: 50S ribosomal protein L15 [Nitrospira bacterium SG8_35_4]